MPDAKVTVESSSTSEPLTTKTNASGNFSFELQKGTYRVCGNRSGFVEKCQQAYVNSGATTKVSFVMSIVPQLSQPSSKLLDEALRKEAGNAAKNCGRVRVNGKPELTSECVIQQFRNHRAFWVRYDLLGVDSEVALGLAGNSGRVTAFLFDSFGTSHEGAPEDAVFLSDNHIVAVPCPTPVELHVSDAGRVTCFAQGKQGRWLGLEDN